MAVLNPTGYLYIQWGSPQATAELAINTFLIALGYVVLIFYWEGKNWARILVLAASVIGLLNLFALPRWTRTAQMAIVGAAMLSAFLIYWLNTRPVKAFFKGEAGSKASSGP